MKVLITTVVLAAVVATPVLAQTTDRRIHQRSPQGDQFYGQSVERPHSANPTYDVYEGGQYVGSDPDPNVRQQLQNDYSYLYAW